VTPENNFSARTSRIAAKYRVDTDAAELDIVTAQFTLSMIAQLLDADADVEAEYRIMAG